MVNDSSCRFKYQYVSNNIIPLSSKANSTSHKYYTFQTFTMRFKIKLLPLFSPLECFYACLVSLLCTYILSRTHLTRISHISNFYYGFQNQNFTPLKSFRVFYACLVSLVLMHLCFISHTSRTHLAHFKLLLCVSKSNWYPS